MYQKPFVEFFAGEEEVRRLEKWVKEKGSGLIDVMAANNEVSPRRVQWIGD